MGKGITMGNGHSTVASRRRRKIFGLLFLTVFGSVGFVKCAQILWVAYETHSVFVPLRRGATGRPPVNLEQDPGFFWTSIVIYAFFFLSAPVGVVSWAGELIEEFRAARRRRLRKKQL